MALALLERELADNVSFRFDLGSNRYFRFVIGAGRQRRGDGIELIADPSYESQLCGPLRPESLGRGSFTVPSGHADRKNRLLQLWSFRTVDGAGPAVSPIVEIDYTASDDEIELPAITFSEVTTMPAVTSGRLDTVPFRYRETQFSNAMFLESLGSVLTGILPHLDKIVPHIGNLLGGMVAGRAAAPAPPAAAPSGNATAELIQAISNPETIRQLTELFRQIQANTAQPAPSATPTVSTPTTPARSTTSSTAKARAFARNPLPRCRDEYSKAQFEPMTMLAALPALMPLLQQVLNPETIKTVLDAPNKHIGTIINGLIDFGKLGLQDSQNFREHLRALNPGVEDPGFNQLIATVTQSLSAAPKPLDYVRVSSVKLSFVQAPAISLLGRDQLVFKHGAALGFPMEVETAQPIPQAILQLEIKDAKTLAVHYHTRYRVEQVATGQLLTVPGISETESLRLAPNREYLVSVALVWKNKNGAARGTSILQQITLAGDYTFDRIDESSDLIPLNDPDRFRDYWHRVWEGTFEDGIKRVELDSKYYYVLAPDRHAHARIETRANLTAEEKTLAGKLKAGMELSPAGLNRLLPELDPEAQELSDVELAALNAPEFAERFQQAARYRAILRGRTDDHASLWVYPEFKVQHITLQQVANTDEHGQVLELQPHEVKFPMPALLHFVGVRSE